GQGAEARGDYVVAVDAVLVLGHPGQYPRSPTRVRCDAPARTPLKRRTVVALLAFLAFVSLGLPDGLLGVAWPSLRLDLDVPLDALGPSVAARLAGPLLSGSLRGGVLGVVPMGSVLTASAAAAALGLLGVAIRHAWPLTLGFAFLAGLAGGAVDASLNAHGA